jgi:hypothetical protein
MKTYIEETLSPEAHFLKELFVQVGFRNKVEKVINVLAITWLTSLASNGMTHEQTLFKLVDIRRLTEGLIVRR